VGGEAAGDGVVESPAVGAAGGLSGGVGGRGRDGRWRGGGCGGRGATAAWGLGLGLCVSGWRRC